MNHLAAKRWSPGKVIGLSLIALVFLYLYLPIIILCIYSFNASKLVTVWGGFSVKWYRELFQDEDMLTAAWNSLQVALMSATVATVLGLLAAVSLVRFVRFRGRGLFAALISAPLVIPDIVIGLSLLLLFVGMGDSIGWPRERGLNTITIAHITFCTAFATVVIAARLGSVDRNLENAAIDLGAPPLQAFVLVTLPILVPALASAWMLSFTISMDDLIIASFMSGPGSTTLPMEVFSSVRLGISPKINALSTLLIALVSLLLLLSWLLMRQPQAKKNRLTVSE